MTESTQLLQNLWYLAAPGSTVRRGALRPVTLLGHAVLLGRDEHGHVFALRDFCPHRGIPLRYGRFDGKEIECCYHGWRFNCQGRCTAVPALPPEDSTDLSRIRVGRFPCRESEGNIWVFISNASRQEQEALPEVPVTPGPKAKRFYWVDSVHFPCSIDHAVIGLMDPSHGPFVHASWFWRNRRSMHLKQKRFAPSGLGFKMLSHRPSSNSRAYRILGGGGERTTEITFELPGLRTEHIRIGNHHLILLTALTPIDKENTQLHQFMFSTMAWVNLFRGLLKQFGKAFIRQDLEIVKKQQEGLRASQTGLMLLGDVDEQALWYYKLKKDYIASQEEKRPFENRLRERVLQWRS